MCVCAFRGGLMGITALHSDGILMGHKHDVPWTAVPRWPIKHENALTLQLANNRLAHATTQRLTCSIKKKKGA